MQRRVVRLVAATVVMALALVTPVRADGTAPPEPARPTPRAIGPLLPGWVPPSCDQPAHTQEAYDRSGHCLWSSDHLTFQGTTWHHDAFAILTVVPVIPMCTESSGSYTTCTSSVGVTSIRTLTGPGEENLNAGLRAVADPLACGRPVEGHERCRYGFNEEYSGPVPVILHGQVTIQNVPQESAEGSTDCHQTRPDEEAPWETRCTLQHWASTVGQIYPEGYDTTDDPPTAAFDVQVDDVAERRVSFLNTSSDEEDVVSALTFAWDFGDGATSDAFSPTHTYAETGTYTVRLTVTDTGGNVVSTTRQVVFGAGLEVNSTGDAPALDPGGPHGCDTGATVGEDGVPECTLRAALQVAAAEGAGEITFDIEAGGGVPTIEIGDPLPPVPASTTLDGTSQPGELVRLSGGGTDSWLLDVTGSDVRLSGLVLDGANTGLVLRGEGATIEGNRFGTDTSGGSVGEGLDLGIYVLEGAAGAQLSGNQVVASSTGILVDARDVTISDSLVGVDATGGASLGDMGFGLVSAGASTTLSGSTVRGAAASVLVSTPDASGAVVTGNRVGVARTSDTPLDDRGRGIRIDGAPGATVSGNVVVPARWVEGGIEVIGGVQSFLDDDGALALFTSSSAEDSPVTGGRATVASNTVRGIADDGLSPAHGIFVWDDAPEVTVSGNTVSGAARHAIAVAGGAGHVVTANHLGSTSPGPPEPVADGISLSGVSDSTVGPGNVIVTEGDGVQTFGPSPEVTVTGNTITGPADGTGQGVGLSSEGGATVVSDNQISGFSTGVAVPATAATVTANTIIDATTGIRAGGATPTISRNVVARGELGIFATGATPAVSDNIVTSTTGAAVSVDGADATVSRNLVGTTTRGGGVVGNDGDGIVLLSGPATVEGNEVVGTAGDAIKVGPSVVATLGSNRIADTDGAPIEVAGSTAPTVPTIAAVEQETIDGSVRTTLLVSGLPPDDPGKIEVFANDDCADGEAERVLGVTRTKAPNATSRLIQLIDRPTSDHFTVTYTTGEGRTSALSTCASITSYPDADGDGSSEPFDDLFGGDDDPTRATVVTDDEQLLGLFIDPFDPETGIGGGRFTRTGIVDDPAPAGHPDGFALSYGAITFWVEGLEIGATTVVNLVQLDGPAGAAGDSYWKYGPPTPGAAPRWFAFTLDEATRTGAETGAVDVPGYGLRRSWILLLTDGQRGDSSSPDGIIVDPGGPAVGGSELDDPSDPTGNVDPGDTGSEAPPAGATPPAGPLARTGTTVLRMLVLAAALVLVGLAATLTVHRRIRSGRGRRPSWGDAGPVVHPADRAIMSGHGVPRPRC